MDRRKRPGSSGGGARSGVTVGTPGKRALTDGMSRRGGGAPTESPHAEVHGDVPVGGTPGSGLHDDGGATATTQASTSQGGDPSLALEHGPGSRLPGGLRGELEEALGSDLGGVRIHADDAAADLAAEHDARAVAVGQDIYFGASQYDPAGDAGRHLIAHEAAHTVQSRGGADVAAASSLTTQPTDGAELEAERFASDFVERGGAARTVLREPLGAGVLARVGMEGYVDEPRRGPDRPSEPAGSTAAEWMQRFGDTVEVLIDAHLARATYATGHPRLRWLDGPDSFAVLLWRQITSGKSQDLYRELVRLLVPTDVAAVIDEHRPLGDRTRSDGQRVGPLDWTPSVALALTGEIDRRAQPSLARVAPRVVSAMDAFTASASTGDDACGARETSLLSPAQIIPSHPMDAAVAHTLCAIAVAEVLPAEPAASAPIAPLSLRRVRYQWHEDPELWNWIRVAEPLDARVEEVANAVFGSPEQAFQLNGTAPFFQIPPDEAARRAPARAQGALASAAAQADGPFAAARAMAATAQGAGAESLVSGRSGNEAALAQTARAGDLAPESASDRNANPAGGNVDAQAARCQVQLTVLSERYAEFGVGAIVVPALTRLVTRQTSLTAMPDEERTRFGQLFAAQTAVLGEVISRLDSIRRQSDDQQRAARREIETSYTRAQIEAEVNGRPAPAKPTVDVALDPSILSQAQAFASAAAISDLPDVAWQRIVETDAKQQSLFVDSLDAMLDDARRRMAAAQPDIAAHGPSDPPARQSSTDIASELSTRREGLADEVLAARRAQADGSMAPDESRRLHERVRAAHVEAQLLSNIAQLGAMADRLEATKGVRQTLAFNGGDIASARNRLLRLRNDMHGVFSRWRDANRAVEATSAARASTSDDGRAARGTVAALEAELKALGDAEAQQALQVAIDELEDAAWVNLAFDVAAMIGVGLLSGQVVGAAGAVIRGWRLGRAGMAAMELSRGAQIAGRGVGLVAEASLNAVGQVQIQGGEMDQAFLDNLLSDAAALAVLGPLRRAFDAWGAADQQALGLWEKAKRGGKLTLRAGADLTATAITGAASSYVVHKLLASGPASEQTILDWAAQGASIAIGKFVHSRLKGFQEGLDELGGVLGHDIARLQTQSKSALALAAKVQESGDSDQALQLLAAHRKLLDDEIDLLKTVADKPELLAARGVTRSTVLHRLETLEAEVSTTTTAAFPDLPLRLAGLEPVADGVWTGGEDQVEPALKRARDARADVEVVSHDAERGRWKVRIAGRDAEIIARPVYSVSSPDGTTARVLATHEPPITSAASIASLSNRLVGRPLQSLGAAENLIRRLNQGDLEALREIGAEPPASVPDGLEWGLGQAPDGRPVLVRGESHGVDWSKVPGVLPLGHTHPTRAVGVLPADQHGKRRMDLAELYRASDVPLLNRAVIMPSGSDIVVAADFGVADHLVVTPFAIATDAQTEARWITAPDASAGHDRLEFRILGARKVGTDTSTGSSLYHATLQPSFGAETLPPFEVWATEPGHGADEGMIYHARRASFVLDSSTPSGREDVSESVPRELDAYESARPPVGNANTRTVTPPDTLAVRLTPARMADLANDGLQRTHLEQLANDFSAAELTRLETVMDRSTLARFYLSPDVGRSTLRVVHDCAAHAQIVGLGDWVKFEVPKGPDHWRRSLGELREALRVVQDDPNETVVVGGDLHAPVHTGRLSPLGTPERAPSFDLATTRTPRSIEVTTADHPVTSAADFSNGIGHATSKLNDRSTSPVDAPGHPSGTPLPITGLKEVVIRFEFFHGQQHPKTKARRPGGSSLGTFPAHAPGEKSVVFDGLGGYEFQDFAAARPASAGGPAYVPSDRNGMPNPGNLIDDLLVQLGRNMAKANTLDRVRLVSYDHTLVAEFSRDPATGQWRKL
jgi:hypothetical protein